MAAFFAGIADRLIGSFGFRTQRTPAINPPAINPPAIHPPAINNWRVDRSFIYSNDNEDQQQLDAFYAGEYYYELYQESLIQRYFQMELDDMIQTDVDMFLGDLLHAYQDPTLYEDDQVKFAIQSIGNWYTARTNYKSLSTDLSMIGGVLVMEEYNVPIYIQSIVKNYCKEMQRCLIIDNKVDVAFTKFVYETNEVYDWFFARSLPFYDRFINKLKNAAKNSLAELDKRYFLKLSDDVFENAVQCEFRDCTRDLYSDGKEQTLDYCVKVRVGFLFEDIGDKNDNVLTLYDHFSLRNNMDKLNGGKGKYIIKVRSDYYTGNKQYFEIVSILEDKMLVYS